MLICREQKRENIEAEEESCCCRSLLMAPSAALNKSIDHMFLGQAGHLWLQLVSFLYLFTEALC